MIVTVLGFYYSALEADDLMKAFPQKQVIFFWICISFSPLACLLSPFWFRKIKYFFYLVICFIPFLCFTTTFQRTPQITLNSLAKEFCKHGRNELVVFFWFVSKFLRNLDFPQITVFWFRKNRCFYSEKQMIAFANNYEFRRRNHNIIN